MQRIETIGSWLVGVFALACVPAAAEEQPVSDAVYQAIRQYLAAPAGADNPALEKAHRTLKGDLSLAVNTLRTLPPLTAAKPGTRHGLAFKSGGRQFTYSIRLPAGDE